MKAILPIAAALAVAVSSVALAADESEKMLCETKAGTSPEWLLLLRKDAKKADSAPAKPSIEQLLSDAKDAKGDQRLDALAAVLKKLIEERNAAKAGSTPAAAPQGHQH